jgi:hypothetical protein
MSTQIQRRRGTTSEHSTFTGAAGEITIDSTKNTIVVHDGSTAGGFPLATEAGAAAIVGDLTDVTISSVGAGEILKYNGSEWVNNTLSEAGIQAYDATLLNDADIGVNIQAYDATLLNDADIGVNIQAYDATLLNDADIGVNIQAYDSNLPAWPASVDATEVGYLNGVTSGIQSQLDVKASTGKAIAMAIVFG